MKTRKDVLRPIKKLVRSQCASFSAEINGQINSCHFDPDDQPQCVFFRTDGNYPEYLKKGMVRCNYFEKSVLPNDPALELAYWGKHPESEQGQKVGICDRCGSSFTRKSNRQKYCNSCQDEQTKIANRERQRKKYWEDKSKNLTV